MNWLRERFYRFGSERGLGLMGHVGEEINNIRIFNCHDHLWQPEDNRVRKADLFEYLRGSFVSRDFGSAGLPQQAWLDPVANAEEGWKRISPFVPKMHNTGFFRCMFRALQKLFDFRYPTIDDHNWKELSDQLEAANKRADWYDTVLTENAGIEETFLDMGRLKVDPRFFRSVMRVDDFQHGYNKTVLYKPPLGDVLWGLQPLVYGREVIEQKWGQRVRTFEELLSLLDLAFQNCVQAGVVAMKMCRAYERSLHFKNVSKSEAETIFAKPDQDVTPSEAHTFEDFMMHETIRNTIKYELPLHIHTGMQAGPGNYLYNSNPLLLNDLFLQYRDARFVLLHGSFPWGAELGVLVKNNFNVFLDFSWLPQISPSAARRSLSEWLDLVPASKLVWGADVGHVEETFGATLMVREILTEVLEDKVSRGDFDEEAAVATARMILRENPLAIHRTVQPVKSKNPDRSSSRAVLSKSS